MGAIQVNTSEGDNSLDALLADLNLINEPEEIVLEKEPEEIVMSTDIDAAVALIEAEETQAAPMSYILPDSDLPVNTVSVEAKLAVIEPALPDGSGIVADVVAVAEVPAKKAKVAKAPKEPKEPKVAVERKHYVNKVERIVDKLGNQLGDYTVLELADAMLEGEALKAKQDETLAIVKASGVKVQNRQTFILEFIAGKSTKLNGVIQTALAILSKEGSISMGVEGNLYKALLAKPYSANAAKAMGGNTLLALKTLKIVVENAGKLIANPNSLVLMKLNSMGVTA